MLSWNSGWNAFHLIAVNYATFTVEQQTTGVVSPHARKAIESYNVNDTEGRAIIKGTYRSLITNWYTEKKMLLNKKRYCLIQSTYVVE